MCSSRALPGLRARKGFPVPRDRRASEANGGPRDLKALKESRAARGLRVPEEQPAYKALPARREFGEIWGQRATRAL